MCTSQVTKAPNRISIWPRWVACASGGGALRAVLWGRRLGRLSAVASALYSQRRNDAIKHKKREIKRKATPIDAACSHRRGPAGNKFATFLILYLRPRTPGSMMSGSKGGNQGDHFSQRLPHHWSGGGGLLKVEKLQLEKSCKLLARVVRNYLKSCKAFEKHLRSEFSVNGMLQKFCQIWSRRNLRILRFSVSPIWSVSIVALIFINFIPLRLV